LLNAPQGTGPMNPDYSFADWVSNRGPSISLFSQLMAGILFGFWVSPDFNERRLRRACRLLPTDPNASSLD
jgi:hypothetical protein